MVNKDNYSVVTTKWQMIGFFGILALFVITLIVPVKILTLLFLGCLFVYSALFPSKALTLLLIYFPARSFFIESNPSLKVFAEVIILGCLIHILWTSRKQVRSLFHFHWFELALFAFCAVGTISAFFNDVSIMAILTQLRAFLLTYAIFYIVKRLVLTKNDIQWYLWTTFFVASILSILGIIEKISDKTWLFPVAWEMFALSPTNGGRVYGLAKNPNVLASFLVIAIFTSFYLKKQLSNWKLWLVWIGIILIGITSVLTYSRGTLLALMVSMIIYIIWKREWRNLLQFAAIFVLSVGLAIGVVEPVTKSLAIESTDAIPPATPLDEDEDSWGEKNEQQTRVIETFSSDTVGLSQTGGRLWIVDKGLTVFIDYPIAGAGFATFGDSASLAYGSPIYESYEMRPGIYSDNQYVQVLAQTGILGVITFGAFLVIIFGMLVKRRHEPGAVFTLLLFLAIVSSSVVYNTWEDKAVTLFIFGLLGIVFSHNKETLTHPVETLESEHKERSSKKSLKSASNG